MLAAPIYQVSPLMGADLIIVVFAVVVIGGMGSILGSIVTGFGLGVIEGLTKVFYPEASNTVIFVDHGDRAADPARPACSGRSSEHGRRRSPHEPARTSAVVLRACMAGALRARAVRRLYPVFLMKALCFALFACAFNLLLGYGGLLSFGHAMFLGTAGYVAAHAAKVWGLPPELAILARHRARPRCSALVDRRCSPSAARASTSR